ncbi:FG-GAP repeat-containing protein [Acanthamoeba castellanii medusavirus]|uniref:FG-GAP repeat-containing protein n=1 Tax=Acanthamoeba castellanii medusavirus J1 TaxID=3114988 RepID=A0A3T1CXA2_9VIRU|nr:FG-GAP repeat-containing protein [Acanthamoeba castellanii medusavirus]BBI30477.1 FG-GAP repeat-containing protein [Acanthamoeba castellanii medusavirus J1]
MQVVPYKANSDVRVLGLGASAPIGETVCVSVGPDGAVSRIPETNEAVLSDAVSGTNFPLFSAWTQPPRNMKGGDGDALGTTLVGWSTQVAEINQYPREARLSKFFVKPEAGLNVYTGMWRVPRNGSYHISCFVSTSTRAPGGSPNGLSFLPDEYTHATMALGYVSSVLSVVEFFVAGSGVVATAAVLQAVGITLDLTVVGAGIGIALNILSLVILLAESVVFIDWILSFIGVQPSEDPGHIGIFLVVNNFVSIGTFRNNCVVGANDPEAVYDEKHLVTDMRLNAGDVVSFRLGHTGTDGMDGLSARWSVTQIYDYGDSGEPPLDFVILEGNRPPMGFRQKPLPTGLLGTAPRLGTATAVTGDGAYGAVSAPANDSGGAVWVYKQRQGAFDSPSQISNPGAGTTFGASLSFAREERILAVGDPSVNTVYIFRKDGGVANIWTEVARLQPSNATGGSSQFGASVAFNSDGTVVVVGAPGDAGGRGALWVFHKEEEEGSEVWFEMAGPLMHIGATPSDGTAFGTNVCVSANGSVVVGSGPGTGKIATWTDGYPATSDVAPTTTTAAAGFASAIALDDSGNNLYVTDMRVGAPGAFLFARPNNERAWREAHFFPAEQFVRDPDNVASTFPTAQFGASVVASADGKGFFVGDPGTSTIFPITRAADGISWVVWPAIVAPLQTNPPAEGGLNHSVSATKELNRVFMGGASDSTNRGSVWMS